MRLYGLAEMQALGARQGLAHLHTYGDECGGAWDPEASARMAVLFRREGWA